MMVNVVLHHKPLATRQQDVCKPTMCLCRCFALIDVFGALFSGKEQIWAWERVAEMLVGIVWVYWHCHPQCHYWR